MRKTTVFGCWLHLPGLAAALLALGCARSSNSPVIRNSSAAAPCPNGKGASKLTDAPLNLGVDPAQITTKDLGSFGGGGLLAVRFFGVETEFFRKANVNPKGVIDVLNIPWCTQPLQRIDEERFKSCVSRPTYDRLTENEESRQELNKILAAPWEPKKKFKECTALVTIDTYDEKVSSSKWRLRLWTAEHCYQAPYATDVVLKISHPKSSAPGINGNAHYVSLRLNNIDGVEYVKRVLATGGGGGTASDPLRRQKVFVLRSMDGRSAETYKRALQDGCLKSDAKIPLSVASGKLKSVDCFTTADMSTFKATVDRGSMSDTTAELLMPSEKPRTATELAADRLSAIQRIERLDGKAKGVLNSSNVPISAPIINLARRFFRDIRFADMITSQMDGIQFARRFEAMTYELKNQNASLANLGPLTDLFRVQKFRWTSENFLDESIKDVCAHFARRDFLTALVLSAFPVCTDALRSPEYLLAPPGTAELEELVADKPDLRRQIEDYLMRRIHILFVGLGNNQLPVDHPFRILPNDGDEMANIKAGAIWTRVMFEAATMRKNPFKRFPDRDESPFFAGISEAMQKTLLAVCPSAEFAGSLFPVFGNLRGNQQLVFGKTSILGTGANLKILPVLRPGTAAPAFAENSCGGTTQVVPRLDVFEITEKDKTQNQAAVKYVMPKQAVVGLDVDDSALDLGQDRAAYDYMASRVVYKFGGLDNKDVRVTFSDSGMGWTFMGFPSFVLSAHDGELTNGVIFQEMPDINTADPDAAVPVDSKGKAIINCGSK